MVPPLAASTAINLMGVLGHPSLLATSSWRKLCVLPESIKIKIGHRSILPHTLIVWHPEVPWIACSDRWGMRASTFIDSTNSSSSELSSSSPAIHKEYSLRFLHLCPGTNFSSHQKHSPLALRSSMSLVLKGLEGLLFEFGWLLLGYPVVGVGNRPCEGVLKGMVWGLL